MIDEQKLRQGLEQLFGRARYSHISTTAKESLPDEIVQIVKECEIETVEESNTLKTATTETEAKVVEQRSK